MRTAERRAKQLKEAEQLPLAPCPFCGSDGVLTNKSSLTDNGHGDNYISYFVICSNIKCACALRWVNNPVRAIRNWNRRLVRFVAKLPDSIA
jgi:hypothetical protein